jgi:tRNA (guanine-N7-)-methyltransferase
MDEAEVTSAASDTAPRKEKIEKPKKADFRQRAHCNPLSDFVDKYPVSPDHVDWSVHYAEFFAATAGSSGSSASGSELRLNTVECPIEYSSTPVAPHLNGRNGPQVRFLDVGCGYGGLLVALGSKFPEKLMLGMEIREQVTNYVGQRIRAMRSGADGEPSHRNVSVIRTNAMKFLPNYFRKGQLEKMFFCFPDPHFKRKDFRRRIINQGLLSIYAYVMAPGALLYHATDVVELHEWMDRSCREHPLFEAVPKEEQASDPCVDAVAHDTEEAKRVKNLGRFGHDVHLGVYRRIAPRSFSSA